MILDTTPDRIVIQNSLEHLREESSLRQRHFCDSNWTAIV